MVKTSTVWAFAREFPKHMFAAMSGGFSVPFTGLAIFVDNKYAQLIFVVLAFCSAWFAAYQIWKFERERVIELEARLSGQGSAKQFAIKDMLGQLMAASKAFYVEEPSEEAAVKWAKKVTELIRDAFGNGEAELFGSDAGYIFYSSGTNNKHKIQNFVGGRCRRITELLPRVDTLPIRGDFDPNTWNETWQAQNK